MSRDLTTIATVAHEKKQLLSRVALELFNRRNEVERLTKERDELVVDLETLKAEAVETIDRMRAEADREQDESAGDAFDAMTKAQLDQTGVFSAGTYGSTQ